MWQANQILEQKIQLPFKIKRPVLALGSQAKNTVCFAKGWLAFLSSIHQDLNNLQDFLTFKETVKFFLKKHPKILACDLHPEYQSTKYVLDLTPNTYNLTPIQHHHAHIASCMAENGLKNQRVIGVAFDGTGLGQDNTVWGAEFLICDYKNFKRKVHLQEIPLLGGERAILEPWRLAALWLYLLYKDRLLTLDIEFVKKMETKKWEVLKNMYLKEINSPLASSMGRLFDAVASLVLVKYRANFEAELAVELEKTAMRHASCAMGYPFKINKNKDRYIINPLPMFKEIIKDLKTKEAKEKIAYRFHFTVARMIEKVCLVLRKESKINNVVLSGGVFQNNLLLRLSFDLLYKHKFKVFTHKNLSAGDASLSLGQAVIANFSLPARQGVKKCV